ncbi:putative uncharacterized protein DDB_G0274535 [Cylas formicarius]|uniref:putative uncharacterized protein DDB_G0274535 n=1 Tax=Cylas formicarius TaxID=197179 RepID=UPI0029587342|nr:putative uncharacterized protein DDB_G0274535 [Cylas formicarius]
MGLFGGFRAKFSKDSNAKKIDKNEVVCLGYRVYSEFDNVQYVPPTAPVKKSQPQLHSAQLDNRRALPDSSKQSQNSQTRENLNRPPTSNVQPQPKKPLVAKNNIKKTTAIVTTNNNDEYSNTNGSNEKHTKSILKASKYTDDATQSVTVANEQFNNSDTRIENNYLSVSNVDGNNSTYIQITNKSTSTETKIKEEGSHSDIYYNQQLTTFGYTTSQAANIFFGEDEPEVVRPRRVELHEVTDDEDERANAADC